MFSIGSRECQREARSDSHRSMCKSLAGVILYWGTTYGELYYKIRSRSDRDALAEYPAFEELMVRLLAVNGVQVSWAWMCC